jgi:hypothetical protein
MLRASPLDITSLSRCPIGQSSCAVVQGKIKSRVNYLGLLVSVAEQRHTKSILICEQQRTKFLLAPYSHFVRISL